MSRHNARETALQMIFQMDVGANSLEIAKMHLDTVELSKDKKNFALTLVEGVMANIESLDETIGKYSKDWSVKRLGAIEKNTLRLATYELIHTTTPAEVVLYEAIELAKVFAGEESTALVNGILNALWKGELKVENEGNIRD